MAPCLLSRAQASSSQYGSFALSKQATQRLSHTSIDVEMEPKRRLSTLDPQSPPQPAPPAYGLSWRGRARTKSGDSPGSPTVGGQRAKPRAARSRTVRFRSDSPPKQQLA